MTISGRLRRVEAWMLSDIPPTTRAARMSVNCASFSVMSWTCTPGYLKVKQGSILADSMASGATLPVWKSFIP